MGYPQNFRRDPNLKPKWLEEKLAKPEEWSVRDRDDIVYFIEKKREQLIRTPERQQPLRRGREDLLERMEAAMEAYIVSNGENPLDR